ncbi:MAG TPA: co-chaperone DjlA [Steroidobacteraceae bacterium]
MSIIGKVVGVIVGLLIFRSPWGAIIGLILGHFYDQSVVTVRRTGGGGGAGVLEIGERFFTATFEVMGHVAKSDGRVSEAEIAAARKVMAELRLDGAQIHAAIAHFTRGKGSDFDLPTTMQEFAEACANRPDLVRVFLEVQVRAALEGVDMQGPARLAIQKVADLLEVSRIELAHMEAVLRLRREQFKAGPRNGNGNGGSAGSSQARSGMQVGAAYQILEVDPKATDEEVAKAYRRQLSKHHPDKLKANGLPESMLEHAKQRTQQIIEAYELIKSTRGA